MIKQPKAILIAIILWLSLLFAAPLYCGVVTLRMMVEMCYMALFAVSLNVLLGYAGMLSFGHSAYFGTGAYATALALLHIKGIGLLSALAIGSLAALLMGAFFSIFLNRVSGTAFAMLTLAFMQILFSIALKWTGLTGGDDGLGGFDIPDLYIPLIGSISMRSTAHVYCFTLAIVIIMLVLTWHLLKTPMGRSFILLKESMSRAAFLGYRNSATKFILFTYTAFLAGVAGGLFVIFQEFVSTGAIDIFRSIDPILMIVIGGVGSYMGPVIGSVVYIFLSDWLSDITDRWQFIIGVIFIVLVLWQRSGIMGIFSSLRQRLAAKRSIQVPREC
jgi:branched-chain amino acid transport system permease protein